jgi:hypothetical protein
MAHFAELDDDDMVVRVVVVEDNKCLAGDGSESEEVGASYCSSILGGRWIQTSYNSRIRKNFAGPGFRYDADLDAFIPPRPFPSWTLDEQACQWFPPIPFPDGDGYYWNENSASWVDAPPPVAE